MKFDVKILSTLMASSLSALFLAATVAPVAAQESEDIYEEPSMSPELIQDSEDERLGQTYEMESDMDSDSMDYDYDSMDDDSDIDYDSDNMDDDNDIETETYSNSPRALW